MLSCFEYKQWADNRTIEAIKLLAVERKDSTAFCLQELNHMTIVEELFISRIEQRQAPHGSTNNVTIPPIEALQERNNRNNLWLQEYLKNNSEVQRQTPISFVFTDDKSGKLTIQEILMHLLTMLVIIAAILLTPLTLQYCASSRWLGEVSSSGTTRQKRAS